MDDLPTLAYLKFSKRIQQALTRHKVQVPRPFVLPPAPVVEAEPTSSLG
jgi:hypothetical protein